MREPNLVKGCSLLHFVGNHNIYSFFINNFFLKIKAAFTLGAESPKFVRHYISEPDIYCRDSGFNGSCRHLCSLEVSYFKFKIIKGAFTLSIQEKARRWILKTAFPYATTCKLFISFSIV